MSSGFSDVSRSPQTTYFYFWKQAPKQPPPPSSIQNQSKIPRNRPRRTRGSLHVFTLPPPPPPPFSFYCQGGVSPRFPNFQLTAKLLTLSTEAWGHSAELPFSLSWNWTKFGVCGSKWNIILIPKGRCLFTLCGVLARFLYLSLVSSGCFGLVLLFVALCFFRKIFALH